MKIIANFTDPYSMLNPETSSDSPSAKSKGVRFNSAVQLITQGKNKTSAGKILPDNLNLNLPADKLGLFHISRIAATIKAKLIS